MTAVSAPSRTAAVTPSTSSAVRKGLVHWTRRTTSARRPWRASSVSSACSTAASLVAVSPESGAGRSTVVAPAARAASAIAGSSVETSTSLTRRAVRQACTARATSGTPPTSARFLPGTPLEPPLAGMTARTRGAGSRMASPWGFGRTGRGPSVPVTAGPGGGRGGDVLDAVPVGGAGGAAYRAVDGGAGPSAQPLGGGGVEGAGQRGAVGREVVAAEQPGQVAGGGARGVVRRDRRQFLRPGQLQQGGGAGAGGVEGARVGGAGGDAVAVLPGGVGDGGVALVEPVEGGEAAGADEVVVAERLAHPEVGEDRGGDRPVQRLQGGRGADGDQQVGAVQDLAHVAVDQAEVLRQRSPVAGEPLVGDLLQVRGVLAGLGAQLEQHLALRVGAGVADEPVQQVGAVGAAAWAPRAGRRRPPCTGGCRNRPGGAGRRRGRAARPR